MDPIKEVKAAFPTWKFIVSTIIAFIVLNAILDAIGNLVPAVPQFIQRPVSFIRSKISGLTKPKA